VSAGPGDREVAIVGVEGSDGEDSSGTGNRRTADPLVIHLFDRLRLRSEVDRMHVYRALGPTWSPDSSAWRELALAGIAQCADDVGRHPAVRTYDSWLAAQSQPEQWLTSRQIRTCFGSWSDAVQEAGLEPSLDPLASKRRGVAGAFSEDELIAALRACSTALGGRPLTLAAYREWVRNELRRPGAERSASRLPVAAAAFKRVFGSWADAVVAATNEEHGSGPGGPSTTPVRDAGVRPAGAQAGRYSDDEVVSALRTWAAAMGRDTALTVAAFVKWRAESSRRIDRSDAGSMGPIPKSDTCFERFGGWPEALTAAGLMRSEALARERCANPRDWGAPELTAAFVLYLTECPDAARGAVSGNSYMRWRRKRLSQAPLPSCALPSIRPLCKPVSPSQCLDIARRSLHSRPDVET
jgi:hypothetical protein